MVGSQNCVNDRMSIKQLGKRILKIDGWINERTKERWFCKIDASNSIERHCLEVILTERIEAMIGVPAGCCLKCGNELRFFPFGLADAQHIYLPELAFGRGNGDWE